MANTIKMRRGPKSGLPTLVASELGFCTDTKELYIGTSGGNVKVYPPSALSTFLKAENLNETSTTSTTFVTDLSLDIPAGTWLVSYTCLVSNATTTIATYTRLYNVTDAIEVLPSISVSTVNSNVYNFTHGGWVLVTYTGQKTLALQFRTGNASYAAKMKNRVLLAIRVG